MYREGAGGINIDVSRAWHFANRIGVRILLSPPVSPSPSQSGSAFQKKRRIRAEFADFICEAEWRNRPVVLNGTIPQVFLKLTCQRYGFLRISMRTGGARSLSYIGKSARFREGNEERKFLNHPVCG